MTTPDLELEVGRNTGGNYPVIARAGEQVATTRLPVTAVEFISRLSALSSAVVASAGCGPDLGTDEPYVRECGQQLLARWEREGLVESGWVGRADPRRPGGDT